LPTIKRANGQSRGGRTVGWTFGYKSPRNVFGGGQLGQGSGTQVPVQQGGVRKKGELKEQAAGSAPAR